MLHQRVFQLLLRILTRKKSEEKKTIKSIARFRSLTDQEKELLKVSGKV